MNVNLRIEHPNTRFCHSKCKTNSRSGSSVIIPNTQVNNLSLITTCLELNHLYCQ